MAHDKSLDELERDVEQARARVAAGIARLRAPETYATAKANLIDRALGYRDHMRDSATGYGDGMIETIRAKASANPLAIAAIAAGVAWRLYKHPPVTTVLVGLGLASLFRTDSNDDSMQPRKLAEAATEKAVELKDRAAAQVKDLRDAAIGAVEEKFSEWSEDVDGSRDEVSVSSSTSRALQPLFDTNDDGGWRESVSSIERRDAYLLGVAALAVGGALALARRASEDTDLDDGDQVVWRHY